MAKPTARTGSVMDADPSNDCGALNTLIGFAGDVGSGLAVGAEGQVAAIHRIGHVDTDLPTVIGNVPVAPENTVVPTITGTAEVGETLTGTDGTWTGTPVPVLTYQWLGDDEPLEGETGTTLVLDEEHEGLVITFQVTGTNVAGEDIGVSTGTSAVAP